MLRKLLLVTVILGASLFAKDIAYLNQKSSLFLKGKKVGEILTLSPVIILEKKGKMTKIQIKGMVSQDYEQELVKNLNQRETYVYFDKEKGNGFKTLSKKEDAYGGVWLEVTGVYKVKTKSLTKDKNKLYEQAKNLYAKTCSVCHGLHNPNEFMVNQWPNTFKSMEPRVALNKSQKLLILKYLQQHAKDTKGAKNTKDTKKH